MCCKVHLLIVSEYITVVGRVNCCWLVTKSVISKYLPTRVVLSTGWTNGSGATAIIYSRYSELGSFNHASCGSPIHDTYIIAQIMQPCSYNTG